MLYERWRKISSERGAEVALIEVASGRRWSFTQLAKEVESSVLPAGTVCPRGKGADFIFQILAAWRDGRVTCPLEQSQPAPEIERPPEGCIHFKLTSATSGAPKLIAFRPEQLFADARNIVSTMGLRPEWPNLAAISLAHSYGFSNLLLPLVLFGVPLILVPAPLPELMRRASALVPRVTVASVPALWKAWHEGGGFPPNTALAISAGAPLPLALETEVLEARGVKIHNFYGSSECGGIAYDRTAQARESASCAGTALDGVRLRVSDDGRLLVESEAVGEGYWPNASPALGGGSFQTSDLVEIRGDLVILKGRAGDIINVAGRKVSPEMIEAALRAHPGVRECVVFGVQDVKEGRHERIIACVALREEMAMGQLNAFLSAKLPAWQIPRQWWVTDELSANHRGKISRTEWRQKYLERESRERFLEGEAD